MRSPEEAFLAQAPREHSTSRHLSAAAQLASRAAIRERAKKTGKNIRNIGILIEPVDTEYVTEGIYWEIESEIGSKRNEIDISPTLLIEDAINPHYEIGLTAVTSLTASEFFERAAKTQAIKTGRYDFAERIMVLTPEDLEKMLTTVEVPWPDTHALTMLGTLEQAYIQQACCLTRPIKEWLRVKK
jgi:hypothetical protein